MPPIEHYNLHRFGFWLALTEPCRGKPKVIPVPNFFGALHLVVASVTVAASPAPAPTPAAARAALSLGGYVYYDSQYDDTISNLTLRHDFSTENAVVPYAAFIVDYDTRSTAAEPEIYNDDAAIVNAGAYAYLGKDGYASAFAAGGYSFGLRGRKSYPEARYGFAYYRSYGSSWESDLPHAAISAYLTAYSRYAGNVLEESGASIDARLTPRVRALAGGDFNFDVRREYGNNYAEIFGGLLFPLSPNAGLQTVGAYGRYLPRGVDAPENPYYSTIRVQFNLYSS
jgi:hypothetical protein